MKKTTVALAVAVAVGAAPALAADLRRAPPPQAPAYTPAPPPLLWHGFYVGGQVGYAWGHDRSEEFVTATGLPTGVDSGFNTRGVVGGAHIGYNYQMSGLVLGVEGDIEASGLRGHASVAAPDTSTSFESRWQGSVRGRIGAAFGPALLYVTGGAAFANLRHELSVDPGPAERFDRTKAGWTVGAGAEYAFSPSWSTRLEYRYTDFGRLTDVSSEAAPGFSYRHDPNFHTVRLGLSYHFGSGR
ncbi:MAG: porin family protein [Variibacter sp.]|nr:porin family protein [Variibacter sp.]